MEEIDEVQIEIEYMLPQRSVCGRLNGEMWGEGERWERGCGEKGRGDVGRRGEMGISGERRGEEKGIWGEGKMWGKGRGGLGEGGGGENG